MRALVFASLASGTSTIANYLPSPDTEAMIRALRLMGAVIEQKEDLLHVTGGITSASDIIDCGNSGLVLRLVGALAALSDRYTILTGDASIKERRVVKPLLEGLTQLGGFAVSAKGNDLSPIIVKGPLKGGVALVSGEDSQPISGLLIAAAFSPGKTELFVTNPGEKPWVALTLHWFDRLGIPYENFDFERYIVPGHAKIEPFTYSVPGDWSSAAYPLAAALITGSELTLEGLDFSDPQGDKEVVSVLQQMGAQITIEGGSLHVHAGSYLQGGTIDVSRFIDAITILPVIACFAKGKTTIVGGEIARYKECDRIRSITTELQKMGAQIEERKDGLTIEPSNLKGAHLHAHIDHRMAMSLTVAALAAEGESLITGVDVVKKSFPDFFHQMKSVGARID